MSVCPHTPQKRMRGGYKDRHLVFRGDGMNADGARSLFNDVIREEGQHDNRDFGQVGEKDEHLLRNSWFRSSGFVALVWINPMHFDLKQRISVALTIIALAYFLGHSLDIRQAPQNNEPVIEQKNYLTYQVTVADPVVLVQPFTSAPLTWSLAQDPNDRLDRVYLFGEQRGARGL
jgi:hypothetical protein